ncbi:STAS domain-containing protein [Streptomyces sp. A-14]|uniref:STAS domain-containing protein n=1 Tax=Streptomyces sp. A-14 TaxID=3127467 RepID=UPI003EBBC696
MSTPANIDFRVAHGEVIGCRPRGEERRPRCGAGPGRHGYPCPSPSCDRWRLGLPTGRHGGRHRNAGVAPTWHFGLRRTAAYLPHDVSCEPRRPGAGPLPVIAPQGEFDYGTVPGCRNRSTRRQRTRGVILDAGGITFIDSTVLTLILMTHQRTHLRIANLPAG